MTMAFHKDNDVEEYVHQSTTYRKRILAHYRQTSPASRCSYNNRRQKTSTSEAKQAATIDAHQSLPPERIDHARVRKK